MDERIPDLLLGYAYEKTGQKQQSKEYYEKAADFHHEKDSSHALLAQLLATQRINNPEKIRKLVGKYQNNQDEAIQWALAKFKDRSHSSGKAVQNFDQDFLNQLITVTTL